MRETKPLCKISSLSKLVLIETRKPGKQPSQTKYVPDLKETLHTVQTTLRGRIGHITFNCTYDSKIN